MYYGMSTKRHIHCFFPLGLIYLLIFKEPVVTVERIREYDVKKFMNGCNFNQLAGTSYQVGKIMSRMNFSLKI